MQNQVVLNTGAGIIQTNFMMHFPQRDGHNQNAPIPEVRVIGKQKKSQSNKLI